jgi:hydroxymethylbilane synthase
LNSSHSSNPGSSGTSRAAPNSIVIASRQSRLALWQSEHVRDRLKKLYPQCEVTIFAMSTRGDEILDRSLSKVGGKGLFVKELETALADGRADIAVHSAKDVPMELPEGFALAAIAEREDPRDCFVSNDYADLASLPAGAILGTSSLRREAQLRERFAHLQIAPLRGNIDTRLAKIDRGEVQAAILATAGLVRLGLAGRIRSIMDTSDCLPAAGQGALAIEYCADRPEWIDWLAPLNHPETAACVRAERAVSRALGGSCQLPLAAYAQCAAGKLSLRGLVAAPDASAMVRAELDGPMLEPERLGAAVADMLLSRGAGSILAALS